MSGPRLLDLFAGEGGAGTGYARAGFDVYAVDNDPKRLKLNPFTSHLGDVVEVMAELLAGYAVDFRHPRGHLVPLWLADFAAIHGSPTCTGYSRGTAAIPDRLTRYDRLIAVTRALMVEAGLPYVIENVADARAELRNPVLLCWSMFYDAGSVLDADGTPLRMERHRLFESNVPLTPAHSLGSEYVLGSCYHPRSVQVAGAYGGARRDAWEARHVRKGGYVPASLDVLRALLGTPWMSETGCFLSVPPAYTEFIGAQLLDHMTKAVASS